MIPTYLLPSVARAECAGLVVSTGALSQAWRHLITLVSGRAGQGAGRGRGAPLPVFTEIGSGGV